jgi:glycosyltransferase involved in cell wall biosynthesis
MSTQDPRTPEVTVVIPTRDRAHLVAGVVASALEQRGVAVEVVVVDDASTDETPQRLEAIEDRRLRVLRNEVNLGVSGARNRGIEGARGPWVAFLDDDDLWAPGKLRAQLAAPGATAAVLVYAGAVAVDAGRRIQRVLPAPTDGDALRADLLDGNRIGSPSCVLARTDALRRVGGFDPDLSILADWDLWLRLVEIGRPVPCPELLVAYTEHEGNMHLDLDAMLREYRVLRRKHRQLTAAAGRPLGSRLWWRWIASAYRRKGQRGRAAMVYLACATRYRSRRDLRFAAGMTLGERLLPLGPDWPAGGPPPRLDWLGADHTRSPRSCSSREG